MSESFSIITHSFTDIKKDSTECIIKCNLCSAKIKSKPTVTLSFHHHLHLNSLVGRRTVGSQR